MIERGLEGLGANTKDTAGNTALHNFIADPEVVKALIAAGADVKIRDSRGNTPLHFAAGNPETTKILIEAGAKPNAQNHYGITPLHNARHVEVIRTLIKGGANTEARTNDSKATPLHYAIDKKDIEVAKALIEGGIDVNVRDHVGKTPLHYANHAASVNLLLEAKADIEAKDNSGNTPVFHSVFSEVVRALVDAGADVHVKNNAGRTPIEIAKKEVKWSKWNTDYNIQDREVLNTLYGIPQVIVKCQSALLRASSWLSL